MRRGMTLFEVLMVVVLLGVLGALAIVSHEKTMEQGYCRVARDILTTAYHGERAYYFTHNKTYYPPEGQVLNESSSDDLWGEIFMDDPHTASIPVAFTVSTTGDGTAFTAEATRTGGPCAGQKLTITQERLLSGGWLGRADCCNLNQ